MKHLALIPVLALVACSPASDDDVARRDAVVAPRAERGIRLPDGRVLPPLNGVRPVDPIPAVQREPYMPPIGPVVGQWIDEQGFAWWITEDGSAFTTRWETVRLGDGGLAEVVRLDQSDAVDESVLAHPIR